MESLGPDSYSYKLFKGTAQNFVLLSVHRTRDFVHLEFRGFLNNKKKIKSSLLSAHSYIQTSALSL